MSLKKIKSHINSKYQSVYSKFHKNSVPVGFLKKNNFGDLLSIPVFDYFNITALHCSVFRYSKAIGVGSLLHKVPKEYNGYFMGAGLIKDEEMTFPKANILLVRGKKTIENLGLKNNVLFGDPGLLIGDIFKSEVSCVEKLYDFGIIAHYIDLDSEILNKFINRIPEKYNFLMIDVRLSPKEVVKEVMKCKSIFSSSLHGLITSDSLGIPNTWIKITDKVIGNNFKFNETLPNDFGF